MAARYVELNPVRAGLAERPEQHRWSSAAAHLAGVDDALVRAQPLLKRVGDWSAFLAGPTHGTTAELFQGHERTGRPLGCESFIERLEGLLDRPLLPRKPGRKPMHEVK